MGRRKGSGAGVDQGKGTPRDSPSPPPPASPDVTLPPLTWEEPSQCLGPILRYNSLPLVVMCDRRCLPSMEKVNFDFSQALMLHTRRTVRKIVATSLITVPNPQQQIQQPHSPQQLKQQQDRGSKAHNGESPIPAANGGSSPRTSQLKEVGDNVLIPEDYKGWFAVLGSPDDAKADIVVPHYRIVGQLSLSKCQSFLIGGNDSVQALHIPHPGALDDNGTQPRTLYPGDVLRMGKIYVGESTIKVKKKLLSKKTTVRKEEKFLLCTDDKDREVYLPVENRGTFYVLTTEGGGTPRIPIMRMTDICTHFRFPCVVKLLFGRVPSTPCAFTGTMLLQDSQIESSVIGCTMVNLRNILLDIPIDSDLRFFLAQATNELLMCRAYRNAKAMCQDKAQTYMRNMKVAYYLANEDDSPEEEEKSEAGDQAEGGEKPIGKTEEPPVMTGRQMSVSDVFRASSASVKARPSIVEDQQLFKPPETAKSPAPNSPLQIRCTNKKAAKKASPLHGGSVGEDADKTASSPSPLTKSPGLLRKDPTFYLPEPPEPETLPIQSARSTVSLNSLVQKRPLPPVVQNPPVNDNLPKGHYMTMDETEAEGSTRITRSVSMDHKGPAPPPKPRTKKPRAHTDINMYQTVWDGGEQASPASKQGGDDPNPYIESDNAPASQHPKTTARQISDPYMQHDPARQDSDPYMQHDPITTPPKKTSTLDPYVDHDPITPNSASSTPYMNQSSANPPLPPNPYVNQFSDTPPPLPKKTTPTPPSRPNNLAVPPKIKRVPSISFADTYLTLPQFKSDIKSGSAASAASVTTPTEAGGNDGGKLPKRSSSSSLTKADYLTPTSCTPPAIPPEMESPSSPASRGLPVPAVRRRSKSPSVTDQQPYETMANMTTTPNSQQDGYQTMGQTVSYQNIAAQQRVTQQDGYQIMGQRNGLKPLDDTDNPYENDSADPSKGLVPPKPPPKTRPRVHHNAFAKMDGDLPESSRSFVRPVPCMPRQNAEDHSGDSEATIVFENPYSGSDFSSIANSCEYASRMLSHPMGEPELPPLPDELAFPELPPLPSEMNSSEYMGMQRQTSYMYYDGCGKDHAKGVQRSNAEKKPTGRGEATYFNEVGEVVVGSPEEEEQLYENVKIMRVCNSDSFSQESSVSSEISDGQVASGSNVHSMDKIANASSMSGYVSAPLLRRIPPNRKPPVPRCKAALSTSPRGEDNSKPVSFDSECSGGDVFPASPPKPCRISESEPNFGYQGPVGEEVEKANHKEKDEQQENCVEQGIPIQGSSCESRGSNHNLDHEQDREGEHDDEVDPDLDLVEPRVRSNDSDTSSRISSEDDLPLGATFAYLQRQKPALMDSGCALNSITSEGDSVADKESEGPAVHGSTNTSSLSSSELMESLKSLGLHADTIETLNKQKIDGRRLSSMTETDVHEALPDAPQLDIRKVVQFISGWRPREDSHSNKADRSSAHATNGEKNVSSMCISELGEALKSVGVHKNSIEALSRQKVDGQLLVSLEAEELQEALSGGRKLDVSKIRMFIL